MKRPRVTALFVVRPIKREDKHWLEIFPNDRWMVRLEIGAGPDPFSYVMEPARTRKSDRIIAAARNEELQYAMVRS